MDERIYRITSDIASRISAEPDLDDFLLWTAGTLEYWIHIIASSVGKRHGWASTTEVPYITGAPYPGTKSNTKWADGALIAGALGVLVEVKTIPVTGGVAGPTLARVPRDFAALASINWPATLRQVADRYSGDIWTERRAQVRELAVLQLALLHGPKDQPSNNQAVLAAVRRSAASVRAQFRVAEGSEWLDVVHTTFAGTPEHWTIEGTTTRATLYAWTAKLLIDS